MSKELQNTGMDNFHQTRIMVNGAKFNNGSDFLKVDLNK